MPPRLERATFRSYGGTHAATGDLATPGDVDELRETVRWAREQGRTLSFSGAGLSFDNQYMSNDLVVSLSRLNSIQVSRADRTLEVGPGARWGDIVRRCLPENLLPYVVITGERPTAGGTLSAHTQCTLSPCVGKEGKHAVDFDLMLADGSIVTCSRERNAELFHGAIAGLGSLGAFTRIRYRLLDLKGPSRYELELSPQADIADIEHRFRTQPGEGIHDVTNIWGESSLFYLDGETPKFNLYHRRIVPREDRAPSPMVRYLLSFPLAPVVSFFPGLVNRFLASDTRGQARRQMAGLDDLHAGSFFMQGHYMFHQLLSTVGYQTRLYQNSYFIPLRGDQVTRFTQLAANSLKRFGLTFAMFDIMYTPHDEPFVLSASRHEHGFHVNTTFLDAAKRESVMAYYEMLTAEAVRMGGRMNLAKNAFLESATLEAMYRDELTELVTLKRRVDPGFLFLSNFMREKFPSFFGAGAARG